MGIKTIKVLRIISKVILAVFVLAFVGYGGLVTYKSIINRPERVRITNITDSAATITWVTKNPVRGVVYYNENGFFLPGPLSFIFGKTAYDDRDVSAAQEACVAKFNENAKNTKDANFSVDGSDFNCENAKVEKIGAYYTHSVTVPNLKEETKYSFRVGNGIWSWDYDGTGKSVSEEDLPAAIQFNFLTGKTPENIATPNIAYGTVYAAKMVDNQALVESDSKDSLVFAYLTINGNNTPYISGVTNADGGWILDKSNFRDTGGDLITDLSDAKLTLCAQYEAVETTRCLEVSDNLNDDTSVDLPGNLVDDLTPYEKSKILEWFDGIVSKVYAVSYDPACHTNCGGPQAPNCTAGSGCVKNCFNKCVGSNEWVSTGGVLKSLGEAASAPNCSMPASCGCTPGTCEEKCDNGTRRTCMSGHYWSVWVAGSCTPSKCDDNDDDSLKCEDDNGALVNPGSTCSNGKKCVNGECNGGNGGNGGSDCKATDYTHGCYSGTIGDNKSKKCLKNGDNFNWKEYNDDYCGAGGSTCTTPTTCTKNNATSKYEKCVSGSLKIYDSDDSNCDGKSDLQCKITVSYYNPFYDSEQCAISWVKSCTLTCGSESKTINDRDKCLSQLGVDQKKVCPGEQEPTDTPKEVDINEIDISSFSVDQLRQMIITTPAIKGKVESSLNSILSSYDNRDCVSNHLVLSGAPRNTANKYCQVLTGNKVKDERSNEFCPKEQGGYEKSWYSCIPSYAYKLNLVSDVFASNENSETYALYLPDYGMYSFQLGDYTFDTKTSNGNTLYIFYVEANNKPGFQMPDDPANPTADEDIVLESNSYQITYEKIASAQKYEIQKGVNIVSFNFIPTTTDSGAYMASDIIAQAKTNSVDIKYISTFDGGRWYEAYSCSSGTCTGTDFSIVPGRGYLIYANNAGDITIPGYNLKSSIPVAFSSGWNLVGIHGYTTAYTARTLIDSINKIDGLTANNVSWWPTSKGKYEGLQVENNTEYGLDFAISPTNGYFVRISEFAPSDTTCKSILWNDGGTLNGTCGNTK